MLVCVHACLYVCLCVCVCVSSAQRYLHEDEESSDYVMYDLDELDLNWLHSVNSKRKFRGWFNLWYVEWQNRNSRKLILM